MVTKFGMEIKIRKPLITASKWGCFHKLEPDVHWLVFLKAFLLYCCYTAVTLDCIIFYILYWLWSYKFPGNKVLIKAAFMQNIGQKYAHIFWSVKQLL